MRLGPGGAILLIVYESVYDWLKKTFWLFYLNRFYCSWKHAPNGHDWTLKPSA
jgi:hypothetical protein